jgi:hypothetical protein
LICACGLNCDSYVLNGVVAYPFDVDVDVGVWIRFVDGGLVNLLLLCPFNLLFDNGVDNLEVSFPCKCTCIFDGVHGTERVRYSLENGYNKHQQKL